jgi:NADH-quinone oxidoreductase subunit J
MIAGFLFYMFALVLIASSVLVVTVRQPVAAVLFLILAFFNAAGLFVLLGAEFLAFILLIVYVGAVAVLFLFVVMMLDMRQEEPKRVLRKSLPVAIGVGGLLFIQMLVAAWSWPERPEPLQQADPAQVAENTKALGRILYTDFVYPFEVAGMVLLVAMIGAILLTYRKTRSVKRQNVWDQLDRTREDVVELRKVKSGEGAL